MQEARDLQDHAVQGWQGLACRAGCAAAILSNQCCCACQLASRAAGGWLQLCVPASGAARAESCLVAGGTDGKGAWQQHPPPSTLPPSSRPVSQAASGLARRSPCAAVRHCRCCPPGWRARRPCRRSRQSPRPQLVQHAAPHQCRAVPCPPLPEERSARCVLRRRPRASLSQVSGGTTGSRRASVARPSLSSTRRWACAPRALCTRPEWTLGARARGGGGAGGGAGRGWAGRGSTR